MRNNFNNVVKFFYNTKVDNKSEFRKRNEGKFEKLCAKAGKHKKRLQQNCNLLNIVSFRNYFLKKSFTASLGTIFSSKI